MKSIRGSLNLDHGWQACYPGGVHTPSENEYVLIICHSHTCIDDDDPGNDSVEDLVLDLVMYTRESGVPEYWSHEACCTVHPLCWHPLPELPSFINKPDQEGIDFISFDGTN